MPNYGKNALSAHASILKAGSIVVLKDLQASTYDPVTGEDAATVFDSYNVPGVVLPATLARFRGIDNKLVESGNLVITKARYLILSTFTVDLVAIPEPLPEMQIVFFGSTWRVVGCSPLNPAGTPILYQTGVVKID